MDPQLASWNDGPTKSAITDFVGRVTEEGGSDYVEPAARVAVFDNDGTLWTPTATIKSFREIAESDPTLRTQQPYQAADNPGLKRPYRECGYQPMVELLRYLEASGFATYIASGGDRNFMRPVAEDMYGIPPERIIGSALGLTYSSEGGQSLLLHKGAMDFFDDGPEKPIRIWSRIGRRPILAFGNPMATCRCWRSLGRQPRQDFGCCCCMTMLSGNSTTRPGRSRRWKPLASRIGQW